MSTLSHSAKPFVPRGELKKEDENLKTESKSEEICEKFCNSQSSQFISSSSFLPFDCFSGEIKKLNFETKVAMELGINKNSISNESFFSNLQNISLADNKSYSNDISNKNNFYINNKNKNNNINNNKINKDNKIYRKNMNMNNIKNYYFKNKNNVFNSDNNNTYYDENKNDNYKSDINKNNHYKTVNTIFNNNNNINKLNKKINNNHNSDNNNNNNHNNINNNNYNNDNNNKNNKFNKKIERINKIISEKCQPQFFILKRGLNFSDVIKNNNSLKEENGGKQEEFDINIQEENSQQNKETNNNENNNITNIFIEKTKLKQEQIQNKTNKTNKQKNSSEYKQHKQQLGQQKQQTYQQKNQQKEQGNKLKQTKGNKQKYTQKLYQQPIQLNLSDLLNKKNVSPQVPKIKINPVPNLLASDNKSKSLNPLDSTGVKKKRGKEKEKPKKKKLTTLKKLILHDRTKKKEKVNVGGNLVCKSFSVGDLRFFPTFSSEDLPKVNFKILSNEEKNVSSKPKKGTHMEFFSFPHTNHEDSGSLVTFRSLPSLFVFNKEMTFHVPVPNLHNKMFREYCDHKQTKEIVVKVKEVLSLLIKFQDNLYKKDPAKAKRKKRLIYGLREVTKYLAVKKVKVIIAATNIEQAPSEGGLDDRLRDLIVRSHELKVPLVFSMSRWKLGFCCLKKVPVSIVGILNHDGAESSVKDLLQMVEIAREEYKELRINTFKENEKEVENEKEKEEKYIKESKQKQTEDGVKEKEKEENKINSN